MARSNYFQELQDRWLPKVKAGKSLVEKATRLSDLRDSAGWFGRCHYDAESGFRMEEYHNPMERMYSDYPNAVRMEVQMMERLLGTKINRTEANLGKGRKLVVYEIATLGVRSEEEPPTPKLSIPDVSEMGDLFSLQG